MHAWGALKSVRQLPGGWAIYRCVATIKRAYGDWTTTNLKGWKEVLHDGSVDGFCLVSSDSDFTRLATRIREDGRVVYGFGERKTPEPFVAACDKFIYTEILQTETLAGKDTEKAEVVMVAVADVRKLQRMVIAAIDAAARDDGWAALASVRRDGVNLMNMQIRMKRVA